MTNSIPKDPFGLARLSDNFFIMLGRFATSWAAVELQVDLSIILIRERADGAKLSKRHPMDLDSKANFLERAAKNIPALQPLRSDLIRVVVEIRIVKKMRHTLAHGMPLRQIDDRTVEFARVVNVDMKADMKREIVSGVDVFAHTELAVKLLEKASRLAVELAKLITPTAVEAFNDTLDVGSFGDFLASPEFSKPLGST